MLMHHPKNFNNHVGYTKINILIFSCQVELEGK